MEDGFSGFDNLITNGDFEDLSGGTGPGSTPAGWVTSGDASGVFGNAGVTTSRSDGHGYALGGWSHTGGQTLSQEVATSMGGIYELQFDAGSAYGSFSGNLRVVADSPEGEVVLFELGDADLGALSTFTARFAAQGEVTNIRFVFDGSGGGDIDIDNVSLRPAATLALANSGLEATTFSDGGYAHGIEGWTVSGSGGVWNPTSGHFDDQAASGDNVGWINSGSVSQVLDVPYNSAKTYDLDLTLGGRKGHDGSDYEITLMAGDTVVGTLSGKTQGHGTREPVTLSVPSGAAPAANGQPLKVVITKLSGLQLNFDNVEIGVDKAVVDSGTMFRALNHNSDNITASHGINYGLWLNDIDPGGARTVFDFEDPRSEVFISIDGDTVKVQGVSVALTQQSDGSYSSSCRHDS